MDATLPIVWEENRAHLSDLEILVKMAEATNKFRDYVGEVATVMILTKMYAESVQAGKPNPTIADVKARMATLGEQTAAFVNQTPEKSADMLNSILAKKRGRCVTVAIRYAVTWGTGEYVKWGPARTAQVWARKADAEAMVQVLGGDARVETVQLVFGPDVSSDPHHTADSRDKNWDNCPQKTVPGTILGAVRIDW